jgi:tRNA-specific 2-thiouridylase
MKTKEKPRVLLAMSGGVDSSVAALLLQKQGYEVLGAFMKNWSDTKNEFGECRWKDDRKIAMKIASKLKIPLITLDFEKEYKKDVIAPMFNLYRKGITPNPDVDCNNKVKFPLLWKAAKKLGADFIATGHYARIKKVVGGKSVNKKNKIVNKKGDVINFNSVKISNTKTFPGTGGGEYQMLRAKDESKDQSYFLYRLTSKNLEHTLFPIGNLTKKEVRKIAEKNHFENFNRKSTVGICFVGKVNLKDFLQVRIPPKKGKTLSPEGNQIGEHDGIYYYTLGQRIGPRFGIEVDKGSGIVKRWYVASKNLKKNEIVAAPEGHPLLYKKEIFLKNPHWINDYIIKNLKKGVNNVKSTSGSTIKSGSRGRVDGAKNIKVLSRIRQVGELLTSNLSYKNNKYKVTLNKAITGISEGQAIVIYRGSQVLGGGVISFKN